MEGLEESSEGLGGGNSFPGSLPDITGIGFGKIILAKP